MFCVTNNISHLPPPVPNTPGCLFYQFTHSLLESVKDNSTFLDKLSENIQFFTDYTQIERFFAMYEDKLSCVRQIVNTPHQIKSFGFQMNKYNFRKNNNYFKFRSYPAKNTRGNFSHANNFNRNPRSISQGNYRGRSSSRFRGQSRGRNSYRGNSNRPHNSSNNYHSNNPPNSNQSSSNNGLSAGRGGGSNNGQRRATPQDICSRCKKNGHWAKDCWQQTHKDGSHLRPNGIKRPKNINNRGRGRINQFYDPDDQSFAEDMNYVYEDNWPEYAEWPENAEWFSQEQNHCGNLQHLTIISPVPSTHTSDQPLEMLQLLSFVASSFICINNNTSPNHDNNSTYYSLSD